MKKKIKKKWCAAHVVMYFKFLKGPQDIYPIMENIYLIRAATYAEMLKKAKKLGKKDEDFSKGTTVGGRPAVVVFAGVRKIISCEPEYQIKEGTEITYSEYEVKTKENFKKFVRGDTVITEYAD